MAVILAVILIWLSGFLAGRAYQMTRCESAKKYLLAIVIVLAVFKSIGGAQEPSCQATYPVGTILRTRNLDERENSSPGFWNHEAIIGASGQVVEAQVGVGVIRTPLATFMARPYAPVDVWVCPDTAIGYRAGCFAETFVGAPYGRFASVGPQRVRVLVANVLGVPPVQNCISVCRRAYELAANTVQWGNRRPDHLDRQRQVVPQQQMPVTMRPVESPPQPYPQTGWQTLPSGGVQIGGGG